MSEQENSPLPPYCDAVHYNDAKGSVQRIVICPVSYKLARQFKKETASLAVAAGDGPGALVSAGLQDQLLNLMEQCCTPKPSELEDLPLFVAGELLSRWLQLNLQPDRWSFTVGLAEELMKNLTGQPLTVKEILSAFASPLATTITALIDSGKKATPTADGASHSSTTTPPPPSDSSISNEQQDSAT